MKKPIALVLAAALLALPVSPAVAFADTATESTIKEDTTIVDSDGKEIGPGILPDSPFYWLDELVEKVQVALTFNPEKKVKLIDKHACERLAEISALAKKASVEEVKDTASQVESETATSDESTTKEDGGSVSEDSGEGTADSAKESNNTTDKGQETKEEQTATNPKLEKKIKACEKALDRYNKKIADAQGFLEQLENPESEEYQKLQEALAKVNANNVLVLGSLLDKLPPHAAQRLAVNIVRSMEKAVEKMEKMEEKNQEPVMEKDNQDGEPSNNDSATPASKEKATPVVPTTVFQNKEDIKKADKITKKEYKALAKEAKQALKQFQEELGLQGPDKAKTKDHDLKQEQKNAVKDKTKENTKDKDTSIKSKDNAPKDTIQPVKIQYHKNNNPYDQKNHKDWQDHGRDDGWGNGKRNLNRN
ncbi:hypothetical protein Desde_3755 [Desulfitobacterium dehalogenans ATCC 51507]|uniref:DUF5667 domain-containing protein n=1 Tax=Desulfitobacterium dehalogenans (strain ATCC 51507 / DSM 9161 / JW/IU-DC1) TaxID=756499 RepID=I4ADJ2_DESDJ|nr:DUF5667 domain-containing protein [Desulfitobacterium dehalogenans]AFM02027.1 hypothetical protein Desde_3755 [Desulfitobacterium dehalogenans ATCC 51507]